MKTTGSHRATAMLMAAALGAAMAFSSPAQANTAVDYATPAIAQAGDATVVQANFHKFKKFKKARGHKRFHHGAFSRGKFGHRHYRGGFARQKFKSRGFDNRFGHRTFKLKKRRH